MVSIYTFSHTVTRHRSISHIKISETAALTLFIRDACLRPDCSFSIKTACLQIQAVFMSAVHIDKYLYILYNIDTDLYEVIY